MTEVPVPRSAVPGICWPAMPDSPGAALLALQYQYEESQWLRPEALQALQMRQLGALLDHAWREIPFWRPRLETAGYRPGLVPGAELFSRLPVLARGEVQAAGDALAARRVPQHHAPVGEGMTSGSTGRPVRFLGTGLTLLLSRALVLRDHLWHGRDFSGRVAALRAGVAKQEMGGWGPAVELAYPCGPGGTFDVTQPAEAQLDWLECNPPAYLVTYPSNAEALARLSLRRGRALPGLRQVSAFGETLRPAVRQTVREAWGVEVKDIYSAQEVGYIALQCPEHEHYHVMSESVLVEILDDAGRPCPPGQVGRVVVTTLHNFAMPLIRYHLGDYAEPGEPCPCGRGLPVLKRIVGRERNMLVRPDGARIWPSFPATAWAHIAPVRQIQLVQRNREEIEVRLVLDEALTAAAETEFRAALEARLGPGLRYRFVRLPAIPLGAGGKYEDFICELPA